MKTFSKILITILYLFAGCFSAYAIKAPANIINYKQPDGSVISIAAYGDEFFSYFVTSDGYMVVSGNDGYLYYAGLGVDGLVVSNIRVNGGDLTKSSVPGWQGTLLVLSQQAHVSSMRYLLTQNKVRSVNTFPVSEQIESLVLLVAFSDVGFSVNDHENYFQRMLNESGFSENGATGSVADYLNENFAGKCRFVFDLPPTVTLPHPRAYYGERGATANDIRLEEMLVTSCELALESGVDFSKYDIDGDGKIDNVSIIFAGVDEPQSGIAEAIWPLWSDVSMKGYSVGGYRLGSFTCSAELDYDSESMTSIPASIGVFAHEFSHVLGLPDMYDVNGEEEGLSPALFGSLSIMDQGNYLNGGHTPPYYTSIEREILGIQPVAELRVGERYSIPPVQAADSIYKIPLYEDGEYLLIECRSGRGWDKYCGGRGLIIYHIDKSENICGGLSALRRWEYNVINSFAEHECARVICAETPVLPTTDIFSLFYPGKKGIEEASYESLNPLVDWKERPVGVRLADISYYGGNSLVTVEKDIAWNETTPSFSSVSVIPYLTDAHLQWSFPSGADTVDGVTHIMWGKADNGSSDEDASPLSGCRAAGCDFLISGLVPGTEYDVVLFFEKGLMAGKSSKLSFVTGENTSMYSYMKIQGEYNVGDRLYLRAMNVSEDAVVSGCRINSIPYGDDFYIFRDKGEYLIELFVEYDDGSEDIISKTVVVR